MRTPTPEECEAIGRAFQEARENPTVGAPRTQVQVAQAAGIDQTTVSRIELGRITTRNIAMLLALAQVLHMNPAWVLSFFYDGLVMAPADEVTVRRQRRNARPAGKVA